MPSPEESSGPSQKAPWWCVVLLAASVFAVSSAGVAFTYIREVPPFTLASWRLQLTAVITAVVGIVQWVRSMSPECKARFRRDLPLTALSGLALALHFGAWVWSLQATSLAHSLLLVSTSPVINVGVAVALRQSISTGEIAGSLLALAGCAVLAAGAVSAKEQSVTLLGDLAAFGASVAVVAHWHIGKHLRSYQPVFVYSAPVTCMAAALLTLLGLALESHSLFGAPGQRHGAFGWLLSRHYAPVVVYLGTVPGIVGHQGFNTVLKYLTPLLVSLAVQLEPVLGPALGWACGVAAAPGLFTWIGGSIVLLATLGATLATAQRQNREEAAENADRRLLKNKSMRLPSVEDESGGQSYSAGSAAEQAATNRWTHESGSTISWEAESRLTRSLENRLMGTRSPHDIDVVVEECEQLLTRDGAQSHKLSGGARANHHSEVELPDVGRP